jgi:hypothetical protein
LILECFLNVYYYLVRREIRIGKDRTVINVTCVDRIVTPRRKPITTVPIPVTTPVIPADEDYPIVVSVPPSAVMPRTVIATIE